VARRAHTRSADLSYGHCGNYSAITLERTFSTERGGPMTTANVRKLVARAGELAKLPFTIHPHMLWHACGFKLANDGHDTRALQHYLGHKNIQHTVIYTELAPDRFKYFWRH
jgi:type 1 fimbriae regulatory protein FimB/type 1 fimbriae regulatory protein FimE